MLLSMIKPAVETAFNIPTLLQLRRSPRKRRLFLMMTPQYVNYGDHAIAEAELRFLKENFPGLSVVEVSLNVLEQWYGAVEKAVGPDDVIAITGGGFMGDLWPSLQEMVLRLMDTYSRNPMVLLPQTIWFSQEGDLLRRTKEAFSRQRELLVFLRDERSYRFTCKELMPGREASCRFVPDMVLYAQDLPETGKREGAAFCLRGDAERTVSPELRERCQDYLREKGLSWRDISMATEHAEFPVWTRRLFLRRKFSEYRRSRIVITDRLHGMLFAAVTGTPCLAFDNISKKVSGVHAWIRGCPTVRLYREDEELSAQLDPLLEHGAQTSGCGQKALFSEMKTTLEGFFR